MEQPKVIESKSYFNIKEVSEYIGFSKRSIYGLVARRQIPFIPLSDKALRFSRASIDKWLARKEIKTVEDHINT